MALKLFLSRWISGIKRSSYTNLLTNIYNPALNSLHRTLTFKVLWNACQPSCHTPALALGEGSSSKETRHKREGSHFLRWGGDRPRCATSLRRWTLFPRPFLPRGSSTEKYFPPRNLPKGGPKGGRQQRRRNTEQQYVQLRRRLAPHVFVCEKTAVLCSLQYEEVDLNCSTILQGLLVNGGRRCVFYFKDSSLWAQRSHEKNR